MVSERPGERQFLASLRAAHDREGLAIGLEAKAHLMSETRCDMTAMADEPGDELADWRLYDVNQAQLCHFLRGRLNRRRFDDWPTRKLARILGAAIVIACRQRERRHSRKSSVAFQSVHNVWEPASH
jgi:hypothetical protein